MKCRSHLEFPEYWSCRVLVEPPLTCSAIAMGVFWLARVPPNWPQPQSLATLLAPQRAALSNLWWVANSLTTAHSRPRFSVFGRTSISLCSTVPTTQMSLCSTTLTCTQIVYTSGCASISFLKCKEYSWWCCWACNYCNHCNVLQGIIILKMVICLIPITNRVFPKMQRVLVVVG